MKDHLFAGRTVLVIIGGIVLGSAHLISAEVSFTSPGLPPTRMDTQGAIIEDWATVALAVKGENLPAPQDVRVEAVKLDQVIPAGQAKWAQGPVTVTATAFRGPAWPGGVDVLSVQLAETAGQNTAIQLALTLPDSVRLGAKTVSIGGRTVVALPAGVKLSQTMRDWGWADDAVALPGWARPSVDCDPAFRNIRAGLGGVPIHYRFKVEPKAKLKVVLGFCESHWSQAGQRPVVCQVEGCPAQEVDPVAKWGQHVPGAVLFSAADENGDGALEISVVPKPGASDQNPILNVIWIFPPEATIDLAQVITGNLNTAALEYVDVGGADDQSLYAGGKLEYALNLPARGTQELTFLLACPGGSAPMPDQTAWTPAKLRQAARVVWQEWTSR